MKGEIIPESVTVWYQVEEKIRKKTPSKVLGVTFNFKFAEIMNG